MGGEGDLLPWSPCRRFPEPAVSSGAAAAHQQMKEKPWKEEQTPQKPWSAELPALLQQPARVRGFPFLSPSQLLKELIPAPAAAPGKAGCSPLECLLAGGMNSLGRAGHVERGTCCSLPAPYWAQQHKEDGIRDWRCQNLPVGWICPDPCGSLSVWNLLQGVRMGAGEVKLE